MLLASSLLVLAALGGCLSRKVATGEPTTKISFENVVPQPAIDKVDLLVLVDNSSSMADKQRILADAVPDLVRGLVQPKCVDKATHQPVGVLANPLKADADRCPAGRDRDERPCVPSLALRVLCDQISSPQQRRAAASRTG